MKELKFKLKKWQKIGIIVLIIIVLVSTILVLQFSSDQEIIDNPPPTPTIVPREYKAREGNTTPPSEENEEGTTEEEEFSSQGKYDVFVKGEVHITPLTGREFHSAFPLPLGIRYSIYGSITYKKSSAGSSLMMIPQSFKSMNPFASALMYIPPEISIPPDDDVPPLATTPTLKIVLIVDGIEVRHTTASIVDNYKFEFTLREIRSGEHIISVFACYIRNSTSYPISAITKEVDLTGEAGYYELGMKHPNIEYYEYGEE